MVPVKKRMRRNLGGCGVVSVSGLGFEVLGLG